LERVEQVDVDRVQAGLGAGPAGEKEGIDICKIPFPGTKNDDGSKDGKTNDVEV
jgi:hypothetical protein